MNKTSSVPQSVIRGWVESQQWEIHEDALAGLVGPAEGVMSFSEAADDPAGPGYWYRGEYVALAQQVKVYDGVAVLQMNGMVLKDAPAWLHYYSRVIDLRVVDEQLQNIADDPEIKALLMYVATPGGVTTGGMRTCGLIRQVAESGKPVICYTDSMAASMGYKFAAAADVVLAEQDAIVGSISTFRAGYDTSEAAKMAGVELQLFRTGEHKAVGLFGKKWTATEKANFQWQTDLQGEEFKGYIRERRGIADEFMDGRYWAAKNAPEGLVDGFAGSVEEVLASLM